jgi:hypothetical protein
MPFNGVSVMYSIAKTVRDKIAEFGKNVLFSSKDLLGCGSRNAVDIELCRLVKSGKILRLTSGVFTRIMEGLQLPSTLEIARAKAERFSKRLYEAEESDQDKSPSGTDTFHTDGSRTSMQTVHGCIIFKHRAPAKCAVRALNTEDTASPQTRTGTTARSAGKPCPRSNGRAVSTTAACLSSSPLLLPMDLGIQVFLYRRFACRI